MTCSPDGAPSVLNVVTGRLQTPPPGQPADFVRAGRYWVEGMVTDGDGQTIAVVRHRYTGVQYRVWNGRPDLDSWSYRVTPHKGESEPCAVHLIRTRTGLSVIVCGSRLPVERCPRGCHSLAGNGRNGAFVEAGWLSQVALFDARVVRRWRLPRGPRDQIRLLVTSTAVFASVRTGDAWRVFRGELAR